MRLQILEIDELEHGRMGRLEINGRGAAMVEGRFPSGYADAPAVARFQSREPPFGHRRHQIVSIEDGVIEEFLGDFNANGVKPDVLRPGAAIAVAIESRQWIATA